MPEAASTGALFHSSIRIGRIDRDAAVVIDGVSKHFGGVQALRNVSAHIHYGRLTGLVGPDGAGKTTLMRILTGLLTPNAGRATLAGFNVVDDKQ